MSLPSEQPLHVRFREFDLNLHTGELVSPKQKLVLQEKPFRVLLALIEQPGQLVTRDALKKRLWTADTFVDFNLSLNKAVNRLREALEESADRPRFVETLGRRGYRWIAPLEWLVSNAVQRVGISAEDRSRDSPTSNRPFAGDVSDSRRTAQHHEPRSNRWALLSVLAVLMALIGMIRLSRRVNVLPPELIQRQLTSNSPDDPVRSGAISPDGKYLSYADLRGVHIKLIETGETRTVPTPEVFHGQRIEWRIRNWFPDGTRFLANVAPPSQIPLVREQYSAWEISIIGGVPRTLRDHAFANNVSWDGSRIVFTDRELYAHEAWLTDGNGNNARKLYQAENNSWFADFQWSPDGKRLVYFQSDPSGESIKVRDLSGGEPITVYRGQRVIRDYLWLRDGRMLYSLEDPGSDGTSCNYWETRIGNGASPAESGLKRITNWAGFCMNEVSATAAATRITFLKWWARSAVFVAALHGNGSLTTPVRVTNSEGWIRPSYWTAEGKTLLLRSNHEGSWGIYEQSPGGDESKRLAFDLKGLSPETPVTPDGKWILYQENLTPIEPAAPGNIMRVPFDGGVPQLALRGNFHGVHCARPPARLCVCAEMTSSGKQLIFSSLDAIQGRGPELTKFSLDSPATAWDWTLSMDGTQLAVIENQTSRIHVLSLNGQSRLDIQVKGVDGLNGVSWAHDNKSFFASTATPSGSALVRVDLKGNHNVLWEQKGGLETSGMPSPDGHHLALLSSSLEGNIWMMEDF